LAWCPHFDSLWQEGTRVVAPWIAN
jgi:hypothetical protein